MDIIETIKEQPMGDDDIRYYFGNNIEIIKYNDLVNFKSIDDLLDKKKDITVILIEFGFNNGHWCGLLRYDNNIEWFDSYGKPPLHWVVNNSYPQNPKILEQLLSNTKKKVIYNKIEYQNLQDETLATCGRFLTLRFICLNKYNLNCDGFYTLMKYIKDDTNLSYDDIVSNIITKF